MIEKNIFHKRKKKYVLLLFYHAYEKYICNHFKIFVHKNLLVLSSNVFSSYNTFEIECNEGLSFLRGKTIKVHKSKKVFSKKKNPE